MARGKGPGNNSAGLNPQQQRFVAEYLVDLNGKQAAIRAGYSPKTAEVQASRLLSIAKVSAAVENGQKNRAERVGITADNVLKELAKLGFSNMLDYVRIGSNGDPFVDLSKLDRVQAAAIQEVTVEDFTDGRGEDARDVRRVKFKLADKRAALVDIGKHLGMFKEIHEHTGKDGEALIPKADPTELAKALLAKLAG